MDGLAEASAAPPGAPPTGNAPASVCVFLESRLFTCGLVGPCDDFAIANHVLELSA